MANIKHTKNELKAQRESLTRYERFLPMLLLKKQQLQAEVQAVDAQLAEKRAAEESAREELDRWVALFSEPVDIGEHVALDRVELDAGNIAGVGIPILKEAVINVREADLFLTPSWIDDGVAMLSALIRLRVEREVLAEQRRLLAEELRITSQRVNLFEKVKIPECRENIRVIRIFLGDEQTAAVVRGKIAKSRVAA